MWWVTQLLPRIRILSPHAQPTQRRSVSIFKKYRGTVADLKSTVMPSTYQTLGFYDGPLVWVDCEMTGLDPRKDKLLEIAVIITNGNLEPVDAGIEYIIRTEKKVLDKMNEWCVKQHGESGLTKACLESPHSLEAVHKSVLDYVKKWIPREKIGVLAGNSIHCDKAFLVEAMPELVDWLHYRLFYVSSIKELSRRWYGKNGISPKPLDTSHRALDDIQGSIRELQWYRDNIFIKNESSAPLASDPQAQTAQR
ncbi:ribonuclease H-like domain-containing protein [Crepidotus variabilis]|uniref:Ribonuclease H-like domain-containing protein n=1 Tax=Crepidotus variabilis TaxID=179855 RepID=A0A9P6ECQ1_9AGAR|nr:ribonuclease H-like domain-containing protein [Crepidotus variabilis]